MSTKNSARRPVTYRHVRAFPAHMEGQIAELTFRFEIDQDNGKLYYSWAACAPDEQFSYKKGREVAEATARTRYGVCIYNRNMSLLENVLYEQADEIGNEENGYTIHEYQRMMFCLALLLRDNQRHHQSKLPPFFILRKKLRRWFGR